MLLFKKVASGFLLEFPISAKNNKKQINDIAGYFAG